MTVYVPGTKETDPAKQNRSLQALAAAQTVDEANISALQTKTAGYEAAWTTYTPTITSSIGTITTASATGRYKAIGKTVFLNVTVTITTAGTGSGQLLIPLPVNAQGSNGQALSAAESAISGVGAVASIVPSNATRAVVVKYDASTYIASGAVISISGVYESV